MNARQLTLYYYAQWRKRYGKPYAPAFGKHGAIFKRLLQAEHTGEALVSYIDHYLSSASDSFAARTGHSIEHFSTSLPSTIAAMSAKEARTSVESKNPDFDALEAARKK